MEIVIGMLFNDPREYAKSGGGMVALSATCPEEKVEEVLSHEAVHLAIEKIAIEDDMSLADLVKIQRAWDLFDLGCSYDVLNKKVIER